MIIPGHCTGRSPARRHPARMTRYFFHIRHGERLIEDPDGQEFEDPAAALAEARRAAKDLVILAIQADRTVDDGSIEVHDDAGSLVGAVDLVDVLPVRRSLS